MVKGFSIPVYFLLIIGVHAAPLYSGHREPPGGGYTYGIMPVRICPCSVWLADKEISHAYIIWSCTLNCIKCVDINWPSVCYYSVIFNLLLCSLMQTSLSPCLSLTLALDNIIIIIVTSTWAPLPFDR